MSKTLTYLGGCLAGGVVGAIGYKRVRAIRTGIDTAHDLAVAGVSKAFQGLKTVGEAGSKAVQAREERRSKTITVEGS